MSNEQYKIAGAKKEVLLQSNEFRISLPIC